MASLDPTRRGVLGAAVATAVALGGLLGGRRASHAARTRVLRPPGALPAGRFEDACARCFKCAAACPNECIEFHGLRDGLALAYTPFIRPRAQGCTLCGECATACPTGALEPFDVSREGWVEGVDMGLARVDEAQCYSFHGRTCGACYRACPLAGQALRIGVFETPHVDPAHCVGCGLCEQACLHIPQAIRVIPREEITRAGR